MNTIKTDERASYISTGYSMTLSILYCLKQVTDTIDKEVLSCAHLCVSGTFHDLSLIKPIMVQLQDEPEAMSLSGMVEAYKALLQARNNLADCGGRIFNDAVGNSDKFHHIREAIHGVIGLLSDVINGVEDLMCNAPEAEAA